MINGEEYSTIYNKKIHSEGLKKWGVLKMVGNATKKDNKNNNNSNKELAEPNWL